MQSSGVWFGAADIDRWSLNWVVLVSAVAYGVVSWQGSTPTATFAPWSSGAARPTSRRHALQDTINSDDTTAARWAMLLAAAQGGDQSAYTQILSEVTPFARALIRRFHSDPSTAEDVVQDTLLTIHRVRHTYEAGRSVHAWVASIARHTMGVVRLTI